MPASRVLPRIPSQLNTSLTRRTTAIEENQYLHGSVMLIGERATTNYLRCAPAGAVETSIPSVHRPPVTQMGGDGGSLEEKVEQAAPPTESHQNTCKRRRPQPPNRGAMAGPRLTAPKPLLSSRALPLVGAPAFSSPPASQQQQWQKVRLDGALEAQRRGPPPRDAGDADGGGGAAAVATATAAAAATSRSCPTMTNKTKYNHRNLQQRMRRILSWRSRKRERRPPDIRATKWLVISSSVPVVSVVFRLYSN